MNVYQFGKELIETDDLDPVYVLLYKASMSRPVLLDWLVAYWCFYHVGTASWITSRTTKGGEYWIRMKLAAGSKVYPRSSERRHFRGEQAKASVNWLEENAVFRRLSAIIDNEWTCQDLMGKVQEWQGFGPWIAFKVADMLERLGLAEVNFDNADMLLFDSPKQGAELLWKRERKTTPPPNVGEWAIEHILEKLGSYRAPPRHERGINCQEAETILCKWKSYMNGHYKLGEDIEAVHKGLQIPHLKCDISQRLLQAGKECKLWQ